MSKNQIYVRPKEICEMIGIGISTFWRWTKREDFPQKISLSARCSVWKKEEILNYFNSFQSTPRGVDE